MLDTVTYGGMTTKYTYDNAARMQTVQTKRGNTVISGETYTYDGNSNILTITDQTNAVKSYTYDTLNRLESETVNAVTDRKSVV